MIMLLIVFVFAIMGMKTIEKGLKVELTIGLK